MSPGSNETAAEHPPREGYTSPGDTFVAEMHTIGPRASIQRISTRLLLTVVTGVTCGVYMVYYLTTTSYQLTTDKSPNPSKRFPRHPLDYLIITNRWTGARHVEEVSARNAPRRPDGTESIVSRRVHVNRLVHTVLAYIPTTEISTVVSLKEVLAPDRFMQFAEVGRRRSTGFRRKDALLTEDGAIPRSQFGSAPPSVPAPRNWWLFASKGTTTISAAAVAAPSELRMDSSVRLRDVGNKGQWMGQQTRHEHLLKQTTESLLTQRYRAAVLARGVAKGMRPAYAEELLRNGTLTGEGMTVKDVVPDMAAFEKEVWDEVQRVEGDDAIVYSCSGTLC